MLYSPCQSSHPKQLVMFPIQSTSASNDWLMEVQVSVFSFGSSHTDVNLPGSSMNSIQYQLSRMVGLEGALHTCDCTSSKGFVVCFTGTLMNLVLCMAWMQTVHIESSFVYPSIRELNMVEFLWATGWCHILYPEIVRQFQMDLVLSIEGALRTEGPVEYVEAMPGVSEYLIVDLIADSVIGSTITCSVISTLESLHSLFLFLTFLVVDDRSAVMGTMIYMHLISFPARVQEDGKVIEYCPS